MVTSWPHEQCVEIAHVLLQPGRRLLDHFIRPARHNPQLIALPGQRAIDRHDGAVRKIGAAGGIKGGPIRLFPGDVMDPVLNHGERAVQIEDDDVLSVRHACSPWLMFIKTYPMASAQSADAKRRAGNPMDGMHAPPCPHNS
jgi:hypothetical protein